MPRATTKLASNVTASVRRTVHVSRAACVAAFALACAAPSADAQTYLGSLTWEANDGTGWQAGRMETTAASVRVRFRAAWDPPNPDYYFAGCQFDAVVTTSDSHTDVVSDAARATSTRWASVQTLAVSRFGNTIKVDDVRDTMPPGQGTRGVFPGQLVEAFDPQDHSNPINLFEFTLTFDGVAGTRHVNSLYVAPTGGNTTDHVMRIYTTFTGQSMNPSTTTFPLEIVYVPGPGMLGMAGVGAGFVLNRRRRARGG